MEYHEIFVKKALGNPGSFIEVNDGEFFLNYIGHSYHQIYRKLDTLSHIEKIGKVMVAGNGNILLITTYIEGHKPEVTFFNLSTRDEILCSYNTDPIIDYIMNDRTEYSIN